MGVWNTAHFFHPTKFKEFVIPLMKGRQSNLDEEYLHYLSVGRTGGIGNLNQHQLDELVEKGVQNILKISQDFDEDLDFHKVYNESTKKEVIDAYLKTVDTYSFGMFFDFLVFKYCADFFPYFICGKSGLMGKDLFEYNSIGYDLIHNLEYKGNLGNSGIPLRNYERDGIGIRGWLDREELEFLNMEKAKMNIRDGYPDELLMMINYAKENDLSLVSGQDLRESILSPFSYKFVSQEYFKREGDSEIIIGV